MIGNTYRSLMILCCSSAGWAFSFGLEAPLASLWLRDAGLSLTLIGANTASYFLGIVCAGAIAPQAIRTSGRGCIVGGLLMSGLTIAAFPYADATAGYFVLRFLSGCAGAWSVIPLESLINHQAPPQRRGRDFGFYAFSVASGMALGTVVGMHLYPHWPRASFLLGGAVTLATTVLVVWMPSFPRENSLASAGDTPPRLRPPWLSFSSAFLQGFLEAGMLALLPLYLLGIGMNEGDAGFLMGGIFVGVIALQVPIGWLADHIGRRRVLLGCYFLVSVGLALTPWLSPGAWLSLVLFVTGAASGALYPLGLALLGEHLPDEDIPRANAWFLSVNCVGSLVSPLLSSAVMEAWGPPWMFWLGAFAVGTMALVSLLGQRLAAQTRCTPFFPNGNGNLTQNSAADMQN